MKVFLLIIYVLFFLAWIWSRVQDDFLYYLTPRPQGMPPGGYPPDVVLPPTDYAAFCRDVVRDWQADGCAAPLWAVVGYEQGRHLLKEEKGLEEAPVGPVGGYDHPDGWYSISAPDQESIIEFTI